MENIYGRGRAIAMLKAVLGRVTIQDREGKTLDGWDELFIPMLAWLIVALRGYYKAAFGQLDQDDESEAEEDLQEQQCAEHNDFDIPPEILFDRQLEWSSSRWPELQAEVNRLTAQDESSEFLAWDFPHITVIP